MAWKHILTAPYLLITLSMADSVFSSYVKTSTGKAAPTYEKKCLVCITLCSNYGL